MDFWSSLLYFVIGAVIGGIIGFFVARHYLQKQINEKMIRAMFLQMGRKPSEAQIKAIMKSMGQ